MLRTVWQTHPTRTRDKEHKLELEPVQPVVWTTVHGNTGVLGTTLTTKSFVTATKDSQFQQGFVTFVALLLRPQKEFRCILPKRLVCLGKKRKSSPETTTKEKK